MPVDKLETTSSDTKHLADLKPEFQNAAKYMLAQDPQYTNLLVPTIPGVPRAVMDALAQSAHVHTAHFELTQWDDAQCDALQCSGAPNASLTSLYLNRNKITSAGLPALSQVLVRGRLTSLNLSNNQLGSQLGPFGRAVSKSSLCVLNLNQTQQCGEGIVDFVEGLRQGLRLNCDQSCCLTTLNLEGNGINDEIACLIAQPLLVDCGVREIILGSNCIHDEGGSAFARAVCARAVGETPPSQPIELLSLSSNSLGDEAARTFGEVLGRNPPPGLQKLNLSHNRIGDSGVAALVRGVQRNWRLRTLDVGVNTFCSAESSSILRESMSPAQLQHRIFRSAARLVLLAHHPGRQEDGPLCKLPHSVLYLILALARPHGFDLSLSPTPME